MTVYSPVCTCAIPGVLGCAKHTYRRMPDHANTVELARTIAAGGAFTDEDAVRVADAFLWLIDDGGEDA